MISVLITGFEPFGGRERNLSWDVAAKAASCDSFKDWVNAVRLPVSFRKVTEIVSGLLQYMKPDVMLMLGMAAKRERISVERLAVNLQDARIPDNEGFLPVDRPIFPDGENALFSTLPAKSIVSAINDTGIDAAVSESAGLYVCNTAFYTALYRTRTTCTKVGFIHFPDMPATEALKAVSAALEQIRSQCQK